MSNLLVEAGSAEMYQTSPPVGSATVVYTCIGAFYRKVFIGDIIHIYHVKDIGD